METPELPEISAVDEAPAAPIPFSRRIMGLALAVGVPLVLVGLIVLVFYQPGLPSGAETQLYQYRALKNSTTSIALAVQQSQLAAAPERFTSAMSAVSYGDGLYFYTTHTFGPYNASRPLPYPPTELWCVTLSDGRTVLVARHEDLYVAHWVVHEVTDPAVLDRVGCG